MISCDNVKLRENWLCNGAPAVRHLITLKNFKQILYDHISDLEFFENKAFPFLVSSLCTVCSSWAMATKSGEKRALLDIRLVLSLHHQKLDK